MAVWVPLGQHFGPAEMRGTQQTQSVSLVSSPTLKPGLISRHAFLGGSTFGDDVECPGERDQSGRGFIPVRGWFFFFF